VSEVQATVDSDVFAPVLRVVDVLPPVLCAKVLRYYHEQCGDGQPSGVLEYRDGKAEFQINPDVKMRREAVIADKDLEREVHQQIEANVLPQIYRAFHYPVQQREHFKIISYEAGNGYFRAHRDNETPDVAYRRFAMTLNLNTGEYSGGQLRFPEFGERLYSAPAGGALVFSCSLLHEVVPITQGRRVALTSFFFGQR